jgi:hypothetical protein
MRLSALCFLRFSFRAFDFSFVTSWRDVTLRAGVARE